MTTPTGRTRPLVQSQTVMQPHELRHAVHTEIERAVPDALQDYLPDEIEQALRKVLPDVLREVLPANLSKALDPHGEVANGSQDETNSDGIRCPHLARAHIRGLPNERTLRAAAALCGFVPLRCTLPVANR
jgi:hypothetical protein